MFNPLGMLRCIRDDHTLTSAEKAVLMAAALRTDNPTYRVRCDQEQLAQDAGLSVSTVKRVYKSPEFRKYFVAEKTRRQLNLAWSESSRVTVTPDQVSPRHLSSVTMTPLLPISTKDPLPISSTTSTSSSSKEDLLQQEDAALDQRIQAMKQLLQG